MHTGGCLCGAVRYRVEGTPLASGICHCRTCRKAASAPVLPYLVFPAEAFVLTAGTPAEYASSPGVTRQFCAACGSPLTYRTAAAPDRIDVMTCSLDDPEAFPPDFHVWVSHGLSWAAPGADGRAAYATTRGAAAAQG